MSLRKISERELADALANVRLWLRPESDPNKAHRGQILHPEETAKVIFTAAANLRDVAG